MEMQKIVDWFGSKKKMAEVLGVSPPAVSQWLINGLPADKAIELERVSWGKFKAIHTAGVKDE